MKRWLPHPVLTGLLTLIWFLLNNSFSVAHVVLGVLLGWGVVLLTQSFWPESVRVFKPWALLRFIGVFLWDMFVANLVVARLIVLGPAKLRPGYVSVPLDIRNAFGLSLLANALCLTPGTVSARLSADQRHLLVHVLDLASPEDLIASIKTRFEAPLMEIFEC